MEPVDPECLAIVQKLGEGFPPPERLTCDHSCARLYQAAARIGPEGLCVELGTWCGWTAAVMASAGPTVLCVDTFRASDAYVENDRQRMGFGTGRRGTLDRYAYHIGRLGLGRRIVAIQGLSDEIAAAMASDTADLIFVDADHDQAAVEKDLKAWARVLKPGGVLCGDNFGIDGVSGAVNLLIRETWNWPGVEAAGGGDGDQLWIVRKPL